MPETAKQRFLIVRLGSLGDLVHTLPAVAALRSSFPEARLDWVVERKWVPLLSLVTCIDQISALDRSFRGYLATLRHLRSVRYHCAIDFQGLYKSAVLPWLSFVPRRIGFERGIAREPGAARFYTDCVHPTGRHVAEQNLSLAVQAGARGDLPLQFPLRVQDEKILQMRETLAGDGIKNYFVVSPGGGWKSKCWLPDRYGALCLELWRRHGIRAVVNAGPGEEALAAALVDSSAPARPYVIRPAIVELAALLSGAEFVVAADTGPLHLAAALGVRVIALFGPTDPARNGPLPAGVVLRNASMETTTYKRGDSYSPDMLSLTVEQVVAEVERQMGVAT